MRRLVVETHAKEELVDITLIVRDTLDSFGISEGACLIFSPHTTAGITINEHADPAVARDLAAALRDVVPAGRPWQHLEGNADAHVKASLVGTSTLVGIEGGKMALGAWQGIFLCEFDGPRTREIWLKTIS